MNWRGVLTLTILIGLASSALVVETASAQETEAATRQFAAAVGFQNQKLYELASD